MFTLEVCFKALNRFQLFDYIDSFLSGCPKKCITSQIEREEFYESFDRFTYW